MKLENLINIRKFQIVSKKIVQSNDINLSLFSFDKDESVSEQSNSEDIIIIVLSGKVGVISTEEFIAGKDEVLAIPKNTLHRVFSIEESKVIQLSFVTDEGDLEMNNFINKVTHREILNLADLVEYEEGGVTSIALVQRNSLTLTILAFDKGQSIASHSSNGDALVQALVGSVTINIDGKDYELKAGESIVMPANTPHALTAKEKFKMMLTVVKPL